MWSVAIVDNSGSVVEVLCTGEKVLSGATSFAAGFGQSAKGSVVVITDEALKQLDLSRGAEWEAVIALSRLCGQRRDRSKQPRKYSAGFGQSAKGSVVLLTDEALDRAVTSTQRVINPNDRFIRHVTNGASNDGQNCEDCLYAGKTCPECDHPVTQVIDATSFEAIQACIRDESVAFLQSLALLSEGLAWAVLAEWNVYAFDGNELAIVNEKPLCRDGAEYMRSALDPEEFPAILLWPSSLSLPKPLAVDSERFIDEIRREAVAR